MFHHLFDLAVVTLAINIKTTSKQWQSVKKCLQKAIPPNLTEEVRKKSKGAEFGLDLQIVRLLLEAVIGEDEDGIADPPLIRQLWTLWVEMSKRFDGEARAGFMSKLFNKASCEENIMLAEREKLSYMVAYCDTQKRKMKLPLQQMILDFLPSDGTSAAPENKERKKRVNYSTEEDEAVLEGAVRFGSSWEQIKEKYDRIHKDRTNTELEVSSLFNCLMLGTHMTQFSATSLNQEHLKLIAPRRLKWFKAATDSSGPS